MISIIHKLINTHFIFGLIMSTIVFSIITISTMSQTAFAQSDGFEKVIENGKTVYKKKTGSVEKRRSFKKVNLNFYVPKRCNECLPAIRIISKYDINYAPKNIKEKKFRDELIKLSGDAKAPKIFIDGKEIQNISPTVIENELIKAGAKRKTRTKTAKSRKNNENE